jgi:hypothetical protein
MPIVKDIVRLLLILVTPRTSIFNGLASLKTYRVNLNTGETAELANTPFPPELITYFSQGPRIMNVFLR